MTSPEANESEQLADIRNSSEYIAVHEMYEQLLQPGTNSPHEILDLYIVGEQLHFCGRNLPSGLASAARSSMYRVGRDLRPEAAWPRARAGLYSAARAISAQIVSQGESEDTVELWSDASTRSIARWKADGAVESLSWSPDGQDLLLLVAGRSADIAGTAGGRVLRSSHEGPSWLPEVHSPAGKDCWRSLWVWPACQEQPYRISEKPFNPWEACWRGDDTVLAVASEDHSEGSWYQSALWHVPSDGGTPSRIHVPTDQLGCPTASPDGQLIAWIEAVCSDRGLVCGNLMLQHNDGRIDRVSSDSVEITSLAWRNKQRLVYSGLRAFETVVAELDVISGSTREIWSSTVHTLAGWQPSALPFGEDAAIAVAEGYTQPPTIVELSAGRASAVCQLGPSETPDMGNIETVSWLASDGLEIQGWMILPTADHERPSSGWPLIVDIHGGPISAHRNRWAANFRAAPVLASQGWAVLLPNPRGSSGRGQDFARQVIGDMGGADMQDILSGIDHLVATGIADRKRIAVSGCSYGGFMSSWMVTQTDRFAAAIAISPVANWTSQHYGSQIPWFDSAFLDASPNDPSGPYFARSPVFHCNRVTTPTLVLGGGLDKNTPTGQAIELYNALSEAGEKCALSVYPEDGHSLRGMSAYIDSAARIIGWLRKHIP